MRTDPLTEDTAVSWLPFLLQTGDALFPTGAYAHSLGFEECVRLGFVNDESSLRVFLSEQIAPALEHQELPYLRFAYQAAKTGNMEEMCALDREVSAWKLAPETRQASALLGARRLRALRGIADAPLLEKFERAMANNTARGHHLIVYGLQAVCGGVPLRAALEAYFYQTLAAICAASLKLIRIGQDGCQRALRTVCAESERIISDSLNVERDRAGWFSPLLEIAALRHERAHERLFIS